MVEVTGDGVFAVDDAPHAVACEGAHFTGAQVEERRRWLTVSATSTS